MGSCNVKRCASVVVGQVCARTNLEHQFDRLELPLSSECTNRRCGGHVIHAQLPTRRGEACCDHAMALTNCVAQRGVAPSIVLIHVCARLDQQIDHMDVSLHARSKQRIETV
eukprot:4696529-Prymnesium_polylepis.1